MQKKATGNQYRTTILCIDSYDGQIPAGRLYNEFLPGVYAFRGTMQMLMEMEGLLNQMDFPQPFAEIRSFADVQAMHAEETGRPTEQRGQSATFAVRVLFRQNASWQGDIHWLEGNREVSFRSVLEFLLLLNSAMSETI